MADLSADETKRRLPTLELIDDSATKMVTTAISSQAPDYFWTVPASSSGYHHPACRGERGLWAHTLMLSTVVDRLADTYVEQGLIEKSEVPLAHAAVVLHDQRKNGDPANPEPKSTQDHELRMARVIRNSELDVRVADAVESHMGAWYADTQPETPLDQLVHTADMVASTESITPGVQGPIPEELEHCNLEAVDLR
ncbi:HD domain-containing protein [Natrinema sp. DC36]|uniref:HD domain-containing protein n=1 Tax=Natrinema sp. DC36 TaxID=2878680 RepID=UPI001CF023B5|nr:HD domain-containing protein [Natrinema sp. DC36]